MSGETGLQQLTDEQVLARLAAYNPGGSLDRDLELLRENAGDLISAEVVAQYGPERAERFATMCASKVDAAWIQGIADFGRQIYRDKTSVRAYMAARTETEGRIITRLTECFAGDPEKLAQCLSAFG